MQVGPSHLQQNRNAVCRSAPRLVLCMWIAGLASAAHVLAQTTTKLSAQQAEKWRATGGQATQSASTAAATPDDVPLEDYLALLAQISPAARDGAQAYLRAFAQRCGRPLTALELRKAIAQGSGDPVLMGMVSASHPSQLAQRDALLNQLSQRIRCDGQGQP
ncbi:hypothetical protein EV672_11358 [Aquabacterium commune]|jgi:hypothetical protein|uniref:Uncharacterized protein n=2 Tax=Aquabacterium commune TaxID=70586 RepID=A0A4R6R215_9BURK|nr:hypothetical protein EV672_11358 [Aquabacterium commune]